MSFRVKVDRLTSRARRTALNIGLVLPNAIAAGCGALSERVFEAVVVERMERWRHVDQTDLRLSVATEDVLVGQKAIHNEPSTLNFIAELISFERKHLPVGVGNISRSEWVPTTQPHGHRLPSADVRRLRGSLEVLS